MAGLVLIEGEEGAVDALDLNEFVRLNPDVVLHHKAGKLSAVAKDRGSAMSTRTRECGRLREAVTSCLNAHDLLGVLELGAPADGYDPEMEDFALIAAGEVITPEVVATVWNNWFSDGPDEPGRPTLGMTALAADLRSVQNEFGRT